MVLVFLLEMLKRCSSCRIIGARLRDSLDMFIWCVLIKLTCKQCNDKKNLFSSKIS